MISTTDLRTEAAKALCLVQFGSQLTYGDDRCCQAGGTGECYSQKRIEHAMQAIAAIQRHRAVMPRDLTDEQADVALRATAAFLDIKGSQLTVNREKMKARYRALVKFIEAKG